MQKFTADKFTMYPFTMGPFNMHPFGADHGGAPLSLIWRGSPYVGAIFSHLPPGFAETPSGETIDVGDEPMYEYKDGKKVYRSFEGTNKCEADGIPTTFTDGVDTGGNCDITIVGKYYRVENNTGVTQFPNLTGQVGNTNKHSLSVYARSNTSQFFVDGGPGIPFTDPVNFTFKNTLNFTPVALNDQAKFSIPAGGWVEFYLPQLTETPYQLPTIISSRLGPVTVSLPDVKLRAQDNGTDLAEKPFSVMSKDATPVKIKGGALEVMNGFGDGEDEYVNYDFTTFTNILCDIVTQSTFSGAGSCGVYKDGTLIIGETYEFAIMGTTTAPELRILQRDSVLDRDLNLLFSSTGDIDTGFTRFVATRESLYLQNEGAGATEITTFTTRKVSPAVGSVVWEKFQTAQVLAPNQLSPGYTTETGWVESGGELTYTGTTDSDFYKFALRADKYQKHTYTVNESTGDGDLVIANGVTEDEIIVDKSVGTHTIFFVNDGTTSTNMGMGVRNNTTGTIVLASDTDDLLTKEVQTLLNPNDGPALFYIDPDTALLTAIDDEQNICTSDVALTANVQHNFWLAWLIDKFWITLNESKGVVETFSGSFAEIGEFIKGTNSGVYHTSRNEAVFYDEPAFEYVYDELFNNEIVNDEIVNELVKEYL